MLLYKRRCDECLAVTFKICFIFLNSNQDEILRVKVLIFKVKLSSEKLKQCFLICAKNCHCIINLQILLLELKTYTLLFILKRAFCNWSVSWAIDYVLFPHICSSSLHVGYTPPNTIQYFRVSCRRHVHPAPLGLRFCVCIYV